MVVLSVGLRQKALPKRFLLATTAAEFFNSLLKSASIHAIRRGKLASISGSQKIEEAKDGEICINPAFAIFATLV
jgi:hypothetical protein